VDTHHYPNQLLTPCLQGVGALVGAITRNLEELRTQQLMPHRTTSFALYRRATLEPPTDDEPVLREIQEARTKLEKVWHYQRFTAAGLLIDLETPMVRRDMELTPEEEAEQYHYPSLWVNLACTFFYMVNYYIIVSPLIQHGSQTPFCGLSFEICMLWGMGLTPKAAAEQYCYLDFWINAACTTTYIVNFYIIVSRRRFFSECSIRCMR
jgi:hypothetical protein